VGKAVRKRRCSKTLTLKFHTKDRSSLRYEVVLTNADLKILVQKIKAGKGEFVEKQTNRVTKWKIIYKDLLWSLVYDKERHTIITCLPIR
jgi:hypothetical protein